MMGYAENMNLREGGMILNGVFSHGLLHFYKISIKGDTGNLLQ
jgi:hypothetical protein